MNRDRSCRTIPNYHFMTDMTDQAINWMQYQKSLTPDKPFFIYFAPGATHAPHHVPKEWIAKYKGKFDQGWDKLREETLARQIKLGVVPAGTKLAPKPEAIKDWDKLSADEKKLFARQMEVFAGFGEYADYEIGRLIQAIEDLGQLDNTLDLLHRRRQRRERRRRHERPVQRDDLLQRRARNRRRTSSSTTTSWAARTPIRHYAAGWAVAGDTPFTWTKQVAGSYGGTRNGMVVHWPKGIKAKGEVRSQWHHVIDIAPTILEAAGLPEPKAVNGTPQTPIEGVSMVYTFDDAKAKEPAHDAVLRDLRQPRHLPRRLAGRHRPPGRLGEQARGSRSSKTSGSSTTRRRGLQPGERPGREEPREAQGAAGALPEGSRRRYHVLPLDDRDLERFNAALVGRPDLMAGRTSLTVYEGMIGMTENVFINMKNRSHTITADVEIPKGGANGVILAQAGRFGGWSLYLKDGKPTYTYNWLGLERYKVAAKQALPAGKATIRFEFAYDGGGVGKGRSARSSSMAKRSPRAGSSILSAARSQSTMPPTWVRMRVRLSLRPIRCRPNSPAKSPR